MFASQKVTPKTEDAFSFVTNKSGSGENIDTNVSGLYHHRAIFTLKNVTIDSDEIDVEFSIPFDNNTEANEAELMIYNLSYNTTNQINCRDSITVKAGYGDDLGVIFQGKISISPLKTTTKTALSRSMPSTVHGWSLAKRRWNMLPATRHRRFYTTWLCVWGFRLHHGIPCEIPHLTAPSL